MPVLTIFQPDWTTASVTFLHALIVAALVIWKRPHLLGTTMLAPTSWFVVSIFSVAGAELTLALASEDTRSSLQSALRFCVSMTTCCPWIAVLGAKRPQDKAWQFIVFSLWIVLSMPALEAIVLRGGGDLDVNDARSAFLAVLIAVGLFNSLPTRFRLSGLLYALAQWLLMSEHLPGFGILSGTSNVLTSQALIFTGLLLVCFGFPKRRPTIRAEDRVWLDFRDMFGAMWGLRVAERINSYSQTHGWGLRLTWIGFVVKGNGSEDALPEDVRRELHRSLRSLLRRFVSPEWIARRMT